MLQLKMRILANLSSLDPAPGAQFHERAPDAMDEDDFFAEEDAVSAVLLPSRCHIEALPGCTLCEAKPD